MSTTTTHQSKYIIYSRYHFITNKTFANFFFKGIAALNNFGLGGVNGHVLLEPNYKKTNEDSFDIATKIPRIINICCRTEEALNQMFDFIEKNPNKISRDFLALLTDTMKSRPNVRSSGFPYRGIKQ